jgi:hypothetical protein
MKILHLLSQRPEATGSGIYMQAMIREAARRGHENFLLAGALERQILAARERPEVDRQAVAELLDYYSWSQVFARVEQVYLRALGHEPH